MGNGRDLSRFSEEGEANKIFADSASQTLFEHITPYLRTRHARPLRHVMYAERKNPLISGMLKILEKGQTRIWPVDNKNLVDPL